MVPGTSSALRLLSTTRLRAALRSPGSGGLALTVARLLSREELLLELRGGNLWTAARGFGGEAWRNALAEKDAQGRWETGKRRDRYRGLRQHCPAITSVTSKVDRP